MIRSVAIVLCDNDFGKTFFPLLHSVKHLIEYNEDVSEETVERFIRKSTIAFYNSFQSPELETETELNNTKAYLHKIRILFDDDAEQAILRLDHDGGSWYLLTVNGEIGSF